MSRRPWPQRPAAIEQHDGHMHLFGQTNPSGEGMEAEATSKEHAMEGLDAETSMLVLPPKPGEGDPVMTMSGQEHSTEEQQVSSMQASMSAALLLPSAPPRGESRQQERGDIPRICYVRCRHYSLTPFRLLWIYRPRRRARRQLKPTRKPECGWPYYYYSCCWVTVRMALSVARKMARSCPRLCGASFRHGTKWSQA